MLFVAALSLSLSVYLYCLLFVFSFSTPLLWLEPHFVAVSVALCTQSDGSHFNTVITLTYHFSKDPNSFRSFIADALTNQRSLTKAEHLASGFFRNRLTTSGLTNWSVIAVNHDRERARDVKRKCFEKKKILGISKTKSMKFFPKLKQVNLSAYRKCWTKRNVLVKIISLCVWRNFISFICVVSVFFLI